MITRENLTDVLNQLTKEQVNKVMNSNTDNVGLWLDGYGNVNFESINLFGLSC